MSNELEQTWKDEYDRLWRVTGVGLVLKPTLKMFIESLLSKQREELVKEFLSLSKRYKNDKYSTDSFVILGKKLDKFLEEINKIKPKGKGGNHATRR